LTPLLDLAAAYAAAVDRRRYDDLAALFLPEGTLIVPPNELHGPDAIADAVRRSHRAQLATFHLLGQQVADIDGDVATAETYCVAQHLYEEDGERWNRVMNIRYQDDCRRVDGRWRYLRRRLEVDWTEVRRA
jgi:hypothetical protein